MVRGAVQVVRLLMPPLPLTCFSWPPFRYVNFGAQRGKLSGNAAIAYLPAVALADLTDAELTGAASSLLSRCGLANILFECFSTTLYKLTNIMLHDKFVCNNVQLQRAIVRLVVCILCFRTAVARLVVSLL